MHPSGVAEWSTSFGWGKGGKVTSAGWQVTLCDLIWHVISRSGMVISITNCYIRFTLLYCSAYLVPLFQRRTQELMNGCFSFPSIPIPSPSFPSPIPSFLPSPPLRSRVPLNPLGRLKERCIKLTQQGLGQIPAENELGALLELSESTGGNHSEHSEVHVLQ